MGISRHKSGQYTEVATGLTTGAKLLAQYASLWQHNAFLQALAEGALPEAAASHDLAPMIAWQQHYEPRETPYAQADYPFWVARDTPGRKWAQVCSLAAPCVEETPSEALLPWIDWCGGKGHLGRLLRYRPSPDAAPVITLDTQCTLCQAGSKRSAKDRSPGAPPHFFVCGSVFQPPFAEQNCRWIALHACGDLHRHLVHAASQSTTVQTLVLAPCCYHRQQAVVFTPLSETGQRALSETGMTWDREVLRLAQQDSTTASQGEIKRREETLLWRLSYASGQGLPYKPLPSLPASVKSFAAFVDWAATRHSTPVPDSNTAAHWLAEGEKCRARMQALDSQRHRFRRPLEIWLLLDMVQCLIEAGFVVEYWQFCQATNSPRNLALYARRAAVS
jgi:hypothetical protein